VSLAESLAGSGRKRKTVKVGPCQFPAAAVKSSGFPLAAVL
jgi:hypothetical protein